MDERFYNDVLIVINVEKENYHPTKKTLLVRVAEERIFYVASAAAAVLPFDSELRDGSPAAVTARLLGHRRRSLSSRTSTVAEFGVIEMLCRTDGSTTGR